MKLKFSLFSNKQYNLHKYKTHTYVYDVTVTNI